jgi:hypothetical protein
MLRKCWNSSERSDLIPGLSRARTDRIWLRRAAFVRYSAGYGEPRAGKTGHAGWPPRSTLDSGSGVRQSGVRLPE